MIWAKYLTAIIFYKIRHLFLGQEDQKIHVYLACRLNIEHTRLDCLLAVVVMSLHLGVWLLPIAHLQVIPCYWVQLLHLQTSEDNLTDNVGYNKNCSSCNLKTALFQIAILTS